ncbi:hypothetical protein IF2G_10147 [Cordyceps javanica]|nr:hypothetical protein IF2G_10147 [Cordyceps javanica]
MRHSAGESGRLLAHHRLAWLPFPTSPSSPSIHPSIINHHQRPVFCGPKQLENAGPPPVIDWDDVYRSPSGGPAPRPTPTPAAAAKRETGPGVRAPASRESPDLQPAVPAPRRPHRLFGVPGFVGFPAN